MTELDRRAVTCTDSYGVSWWASSGQGGHLSGSSNCAYGEFSMGLSFGEIKCNQRLKKLRTSDSSTLGLHMSLHILVLIGQLQFGRFALAKSMIAIGGV